MSGIVDNGSIAAGSGSIEDGRSKHNYFCDHSAQPAQGHEAQQPASKSAVVSSSTQRGAAAPRSYSEVARGPAASASAMAMATGGEVPSQEPAKALRKSPRGEEENGHGSKRACEPVSNQEDVLDSWEQWASPANADDPKDDCTFAIAVEAMPLPEKPFLNEEAMAVTTADEPATANDDEDSAAEPVESLPPTPRMVTQDMTPLAHESESVMHFFVSGNLGEAGGTMTGQQSGDEDLRHCKQTERSAAAGIEPKTWGLQASERNKRERNRAPAALMIVGPPWARQQLGASSTTPPAPPQEQSAAVPPTETGVGCPAAYSNPPLAAHSAPAQHPQSPPMMMGQSQTALQGSEGCPAAYSNPPASGQLASAQHPQSPPMMMGQSQTFQECPVAYGNPALRAYVAPAQHPQSPPMIMGYGWAMQGSAATAASCYSNQPLCTPHGNAAPGQTQQMMAAQHPGEVVPPLQYPSTIIITRQQRTTQRARRQQPPRQRRR